MERSDRNYFDAINPNDGKKFRVAITNRRAHWIALRGEGAIREMAHLVTSALLHFTKVFEGIRWDCDEDTESDSDGWLCYCARPEYAYSKGGAKIPPHDGEVFLVFVNHEGVAYNWRWDKADKDNPNMPHDWKTRFHRPIL